MIGASTGSGVTRQGSVSATTGTGRGAPWRAGLAGTLTTPCWPTLPASVAVPGWAARTAPDRSPTSIQNSWLTAVKVRYSEVTSSTTTLTTVPRQTAPRTRRMGSWLVLVVQATAATVPSMTMSTASPGTPALNSCQM